MVTRFHLVKLIVAAVAACIAVSSYAQAGPFGRGGGGQFGGNTGSFGGNGGSGFSGLGSRDRQSQTPDRSRDFGQQNNSADNSGDFTRTRDRDSAGDDADASQPDQRGAAQGADNQSDRSRGGSLITRHGAERAVETSHERDNAGVRESSEARGEKSEVAKKFDSSLLFADVPGANAHQSGPTNNPGLEHMSQQGLQSSEIGRTTAQNAIAQAGSSHSDSSQHFASRQGDDDHLKNSHHHPLSDQQVDLAKTILKENFTGAQLERLKDTLRGGVTDQEQKEVRELLTRNLTDRQTELVKQYLTELVRAENEPFPH